MPESAAPASDSSLLGLLLGGGAAAPAPPAAPPVPKGETSPPEVPAVPAAPSAGGGGLFDLLLGGTLSAPNGSKPTPEQNPDGGQVPADKPGDALTEVEIKEVEKHYHEGLQKLLDFIAPPGMEVDFRHLKVGDRYARSFFVFNWPSHIAPNWLSPIINLDAMMDVAQFIYPAPSARVMKMLTRKVTEMRSTIHIQQDKGMARDPSLEAALEDAEQLRDLLARGFEKLFHFGLYLTVYAESLDKLVEIQTKLESMLGSKLVLLKPATFQMEHAYTSTLPYCLDELEINRNMNTSPLGTTFPFNSAELTSDKGILYGINRHNDSLVIFDRFSLPNANSTLFAASGAGKSYAVKLEVLRSLMVGTDVYVIDPENEYTDLSGVVGGAVVPLSLQTTHRINPFDLPASVHKDDEESRPGELLRAASVNLHGLFALMLGKITPEEDSLLDRAVIDTYALRGITFETASPGVIEPPTLKEFVEVLRTNRGCENMARIMEKYTDGSYAGIFDQPTNVNLDSRLMVFQTRDLEEALRPLAIYIVLNFLWNRVRSSLKRRLIVVDEAWNVMQYEDSARFLFGLFKRARKYYLGLTTISQDIEDFMRSPFGKPIITNSAMQILLKQAPSAASALKEAFNLTEGEKYLLLNAGVGQGLFFAGNKHVAIQIVASPKEHEIVTTNPEEMLRRAPQEKQE